MAPAGLGPEMVIFFLSGLLAAPNGSVGWEALEDTPRAARTVGTSETGKLYENARKAKENHRKHRKIMENIENP